MDYEKLHKDTINRLQQMVGCGKITVETACGICADFVPESEDERIRKNCIHFLELQKQHHAATFEIEECIAWLEKQGEHAKFRDSIQVGDKVTRNEDGVLVNLSQLKRAAKPAENKGEHDMGISEATKQELEDKLHEALEKETPESCNEFLEKQGEQKLVEKVEPKFHEGEWITNGDYTWKIVEVKPLDYVLQSQDGNIVDDTISHVDEQFHSFTIEDTKDGDQCEQKPFGQRKECEDCQFNYAGECKGYCALKRNEQKTVDNIEPRFKVGDWVILTAGELSTTLQIISVSTDKKLYWFNDSSYLPIVDKECLHLWTIQDAKNGDVLTWDDSKCIALFKNIYDKDSFNSYGFVGHLTGVFESGLCYHDIEGAHPATKEQRDLLFQKMKEAGYEWDADKKELKKIEQKPAEWSEEDKKMSRFIGNAITADDASTYLKDKCIEVIDAHVWLDSLKDRVKSQNLTINDEELNQAKKEAYNDALNKIEYHSGEPTFDDGWSAAIWYLKKRNAQLQSIWKPSDEQMNTLDHYMHTLICNEYKEILFGLYADLKKLRKK